MASLIEKTQTLIQANLHAIVDRALESNSVAVMKQYIRDAEANLDELEKAAATVGGEVKTLERKYKEYKKIESEIEDALFLMQEEDDEEQDPEVLPYQVLRSPDDPADDQHDDRHREERRPGRHQLHEARHDAMQDDAR